METYSDDGEKKQGADSQNFLRLLTGKNDLKLVTYQFWYPQSILSNFT